jgi:hypothetical protein
VPSSPLALEHRVLLSSLGVTELPHPIPAGVLTLPIFRAAVKRGTPDASGLLPESAWRTRVTIAEAAGRYSLYEITGDPEQGLPYGADGDIMLALAALADGADADGRPFVDPLTGTFAAPSLRMIARVLGLDMNKERAERIKGALERLAAVRIRHVRLRHTEAAAESGELLLALPPGNAYPVWLDAPGRGGPGEPAAGRPGGRARARAERVPATPAAEQGGWVEEAEGSEYLITYAWRTDYHRTPRGEDWISKLTINPTLLGQGERGWGGWIDCPTHARLTRPIAKRLYQLTAAAAARQAPLRFELSALRQLCGMAGGAPSQRVAHVRDDILAAAAELREHDVLAGAEVVSVSRGQYVFHFEPGARLHVAGWLRGVGRLDLTEHRVQRLLLASLDVAPRVAERLVAESAGQVHRMLAYVLYQRERGRPVVAPGRYVTEGVAQGWSYDTNEDFQRWLRQRTHEVREQLAAGAGAAGPPALPRGAPAVDDAPPPVSAAEPATATEPGVSVAPPAAEPALALPSVGAEVEGWWRSVVAQVGTTLHALPRAYLERARPAAYTGVTLLVVASSDGERDRLAREVARLTESVGTVSGGAVCEVVLLSPQQWRARADDLAADDAPDASRTPDS